MRTFLFVAALVLPPAPQDTRPDPQAELKKRFKERTPALKELSKGGKIGETPAGTAEALKPEYLDQKVNPAAGGETIRELLEKENQDRKSLYQILAKAEGLPPAEVAKQDYLRRLKEAPTEHWFKTPEGKWLQKKDLPK